jgi:triacylglycerol lipase
LNWRATHLFQIDNPHLKQREFHPRTAYRDPAIVKAFGSSTPPSNTVLLHLFDPPDCESHPPVLLVPGANKSANFFLDPDEDGSFRALPEAIRRSGRQVYALSFAHNQDDNWWCCEAINECLLEMSRRHPDRRFDVVGHSKGGVSARLAATDWRPHECCQRYLGGLIRRVVLLGAPNLGVDFFFRYPQVNRAFYGDSDEQILNWPLSWQEIKRDGEWVDCERQSYLGPYYPGQGQMLSRFDRFYPLDGKHSDQEITYFGGRGKGGFALGLDRVGELTGSLIGEFEQRPPVAEVALVAGTSATLPGALNDTSGPGDGIVYVRSALHCPDDARVCFMAALPVHHKALAAEPQAQTAIVEALNADGLMSLRARQSFLSRVLS